VVYVGGVTKDKGIRELIDALDYIQVKLELAGPFESEAFRAEIEKKPGWKKVNYHGNVDRQKVLELLRSSMAGVVAFNPVPNYVNSLPIKMFEYMSAGLPVVCSNFETWKEIVEDNGCGVSADPMVPRAIADKITEVLRDSDKAVQMGKNGVRLIREKFNWEKEKEKLFEVYATLLRI
jgi:glycosyltransferase involved in cell wall biosynthesis